MAINDYQSKELVLSKKLCTVKHTDAQDAIVKMVHGPKVRHLSYWDKSTWGEEKFVKANFYWFKMSERKVLNVSIRKLFTLHSHSISRQRK